MIEVIFLLMVIALIAIFILNVRYDFAYVTLFIASLIQGHKFKIVRKNADIKKALMLSDKGSVIEELLALPAWYPILSLESVNHDLWKELKRNFLKFSALLPSKTELGDIAEQETKIFLEKNSNKMDSADISKLTLKIFTNWIFKDTTFEHDNALTGLTDDMIDKIYSASVEFKKELALKGKGCQLKKQESIDIMVNLLSNNSKFKNLFDDWSKPEHFSTLMQPYIISPMINVADIAVSINENRSIIVNDQKSNTDQMDVFIDYCIQVSHPFPMLERYDPQTNTQIFIDITNFKEANNFQFNYGIGPRACPGRHYAKEFLSRMMNVVLNTEQNVHFNPEENHLYSGRNNDNANLKESLYQLKVLGQMFVDSFYKRVNQKSY